MGVNVQKPANAAESTSEAAEPAAPKTVSLELALYKRWVDNREPTKPLYIAGTEYIFLEAVATKMLQLHEDGKPIFRRYKAKPPRRIVLDEKVPVDMTTSTAPAATPGTLNPTTNRIEIGDADELKDLLTEKEQEGSEDAGDESAHEV